MQRSEHVYLSVSDLEEAIRNYVFLKYPDLKGKAVESGMYPGHTYIGSFTDVKDEDRNKPLISVKVLKDTPVDLNEDRLKFPSDFIMTLSDVEDLDELLEAVDDLDDAYTRGYLIATIEEQGDSLEYDEICENLMVFVQGYMEG